MKYIVFLFLVMCLPVSIGATGFTEGLFLQSPIEKKFDLYLFHSEECDKCRTALPGIASLISSMHPYVNVKTLDLKDPKHFELLRSIEVRLNRRTEELPVAVIGNHILSGEKEILEKINQILSGYVFAPPPPITASPGNTEQTAQKKIQAKAIYFYQNGCAKCSRIDTLLNYITQKYPDLSLRRVDITTPEGKRLNEAIGKRLNLSEKERLLAPSLLIGYHFLYGKDLTDERIEEALLANDPNQPPLISTLSEEEVNRADESIIARFKSLSAIPVALAGLLDGINPCAFATLIFLISFLTMKGRKKGDVLKIGLGFTASVFITYLLIGIGFFSFIQRLTFTQSLSKIFYFLTFAFTVSMGILSFHDYLLWKKGRAKEMKLQLPGLLKRTIHRSIRTTDWSRYYLAGAILSGFIISVLEFACTGQVYLPTILFVMNISSLMKEAIPYLVLYNLAFITPLLAVFGLFYTGTTHERFAVFLNKRGPLAKLLTSLLFFSLAALMLVMR